MNLSDSPFSFLHFSLLVTLMADSKMRKTGALLLSSCWKHYGLLLHLEDYKISGQYRELLQQYLSGIQVSQIVTYMKDLQFVFFFCVFFVFGLLFEGGDCESKWCIGCWYILLLTPCFSFNLFCFWWSLLLWDGMAGSLEFSDTIIPNYGVFLKFLG